MTVRHKAFAATIKGTAPNGATRLVVATLGVPDRDGDVTLPGFFGEQTVPILPAHDWQHVPLGKGRLYEVGEEAMVDADWNLDIPEARSWFAAVKFDLEHPPPLQQWSYGFQVRQGGSRLGQWKGRRVQFLQPLSDGSPGADVFEVSPVVRGAGVSTRTLSTTGEVDLAHEYARYLAAAHAAAPREQAAREYARFVHSTLEVPA